MDPAGVAAHRGGGGAAGRRRRGGAQCPDPSAYNTRARGHRGRRAGRAFEGRAPGRTASRGAVGGGERAASGVRTGCGSGRLERAPVACLARVAGGLMKSLLLMKSLVWILMVATTLPLVAQEPEDTVAASPAQGAEAQELRQQIRQRWNEHVRSTLGLTDDQNAKLQATEQRFEGQRQPIRARQREINQSLNAELTSGTPNQDRVRQTG